MDDRKTQIMRAALRVYALYGLRRSSMADVAREAGLSRPALYQYFQGKDDLTSSCVDMVIEDGFAIAEAALADQSGARARVTAYLSANLTFYHRILYSGPHSDEVLDIRARFGTSKLATTQDRLVTRLNQLAGKPRDDELGIILANAGEGLKMRAPDEATLARRLAVLVTGLVAANG